MFFAPKYYLLFVRKPNTRSIMFDGGGEAGQPGSQRARSLGHLIQLLAILLWDHYRALLLCQSAFLLRALSCLAPQRTGCRKREPAMFGTTRPRAPIQ